MLVGFSLVKNEADIIEPFVRHNLQYLDFLVIGDNASSDNTRAILLALQAEGLRLAVFDDPIFAYAQSQKMTRIARYLHRTLRPDFLFPLDADEFISANTRSDVLSALASIPEGGVGFIPWVSHVISPSDTAAGEIDPPRTLSFRRRSEEPQYFKINIRVTGMEVLGFSIDQGSHSVTAAPGESVDSVLSQNLSLGHFPVRSSAQLATKAILGWMAYLRLNPNADRSSAGYQWKENFVHFLEQEGISQNELPERSMLYAQHRKRDRIDWDFDIIPSSCVWRYSRRYAGLSRRSPLVEVARAWASTFKPQQENSLTLEEATLKFLRFVK